MKPTFEGLVKLDKEVSLFVRQFGSSQKDLMIIHGGPDWDHSYFLPTILPLANRFKLTLFDLRGCGLSVKLTSSLSYSTSLAAMDVSNLIQALGLNQPALLGFSFGGRVLMELIKQKSDQVRAVVLASTTAYTNFQSELDTWDDFRHRHTSEMKEKVRAILKSTVSSLEKSKNLAMTTAPLDIWNLDKLGEYRLILDKIRFSGEWMTAWQSGAMTTSEATYEQALIAFKKPTLILHGNKDMRFPVSVAKKLNLKLPNSTLSILNDTGHMSHIESPFLWNNKISDFLEPLF